ncbi:MAG: nitroreductase family deazaflavin-dependent oxidoreductase [Actinomycetia bacterium]|nr:nitroreductase family deazaflavin-dependent oxidoreductase [Actinomycetes bacterium]
MTDPGDFNSKVIAEFRDNDGKVGGNFEGANLLLLHHTGARSGTERVSPLAYQQVGNGYAIFASKAGAPVHPAWYHNLVANPETTIEVGGSKIKVRARVADDAERDPIWEKQKVNAPQFAGYEEKAAGVRKIPVVVLDPIN